MRAVLRLLAACTLALALNACARDGVASPDAGAPAGTAPVAAADPSKQPAAAPAGEVDFSCSSDAECTIKDVGNCCGAYPMCVNVDSPTFPEKVKADCAAEGRMGVCGFPAISSCQCVANRCEGVTDGAAASGLDLR